MFVKLKSPILVQWEITYDCNKNCMHCYNFWRDETTKIDCDPYFNDEVCKEITNQLIENEVFQVIITGGEPLLVFDKIYPYLKKLREHNIRLSLNSNLSYINEDIISKIKELGITTILTSMPASNKELDYKITNNRVSFDATSSNIKKVINAGINVTPNMVLTQINYDDILENAKLVKSLGCKNFSVSRAIQPENCKDFSHLRLSKDQFVKLPNMLKSIKETIGINIYSIEGYPLCFTEDNNLRNELGFSRLCMAGKTFCVVSPDGEVRPCILLSETYKENLKNAWDKMSHYRDDSLLPEECLGCKLKDQCAGGCKAERLHSCHDVKAMDMISNPSIMHKITLKTNTFKKIECLNKQFKFSDKILFRTEEFGGIIYLNNSSFMAVNSSLYNFAINNKNFTFENFKESLNIDNVRAENIINEMIRKKIVIIKEESDEKRI